MRNFISILFILLVAHSFSQPARYPLKINKVIFAEPMPDSYAFYNLSEKLDAARLNDAPYRFERVSSDIFLHFPVDELGHFEKFEMFKTRYMEADLSSEYPDIQTFAGKSKTGKLLYLSVTPYGIHGTVLRPGQNTFLVKQYDPSRWIAFDRAEQPTEETFICETPEAEAGTSSNSDTQARPLFFDGIMRKYRYAISTTGEFSQYHLNRLGIPPSETDANKKAAVIGELVTAITRMNSVYEKDFAISLMLVNNNDAIVFLDASNDPFDNNTTSMGSLLNANQNTQDNYIGSTNYDVGQVWCQGGLQGLAQLTVVCSSGMKARGAVRGSYPETDRFIISVASHELGHQFGAQHVFYNSCGGNRQDDHAVEIGSGTTIMAYAGICPPNLQYFTDDRFNYISIKDFRANLFDTGSCSQNINLNNQAPSVNAGPDRYIPKQTPFVLTAVASDPDGDTLTYVWDEEDIPSHNQSSPPQPTWIDGPMFRPYAERTENYRYFPKLDDILSATGNNPSTQWEVLPSVGRLLKFNVTVRDRNLQGGQTMNDVIYLGIDASAGPFVFTSQTSDEIWAVGQTVNITWDVAGTNTGNVNTPYLHLLLARDGRHFTDTLAAHIVNNGSYSFTVPAHLSTPNGRIMLKADNNYFFAVALGTITIGNYQETCNHTFTSSPNISIPDNDLNGIADTLSITENELISDLNVHVNITHPYVSDLKISLTAPDGTEQILWDNSCGGQDNLSVTFDDEGSTISCNNLTGHIIPVNPLHVFDSKYTQGDWILKVQDTQSPDGGLLNGWSLDFCYIQQHVEKTDFDFVNVYPNPASDILSVELPNQNNNNINISVYDINGRRLIEKNITPSEPFVKISLNILNLSDGNYILRIQQGKYFYNGIVIKK